MRQLGKRDTVSIFRLLVHDSFHGYRESGQIDKFLHSLALGDDGDQAEALVALLQKFQPEIDMAYDSDAGKALLRERHLLLEDLEGEPGGEAADDNGEPAEKRRRVGSAAASAAAIAAHPNDDLPKSVSSDRYNLKLTGIRGFIEGPEDQFLRPRTRQEYHQEFKSLPFPASHAFSHEKNMLRRLLSYGNRRKWTVEDLQNPAFRERAHELLLQVHLGSPGLDMRPVPMIGLSDRRRERLDNISKRLVEAGKEDEDFPDMVDRSGNRAGSRGRKDVQFDTGLSVVELEKRINFREGIGAKIKEIVKGWKTQANRPDENDEDDEEDA